MSAWRPGSRGRLDDLAALLRASRERETAAAARAPIKCKCAWAKDLGCVAGASANLEAVPRRRGGGRGSGRPERPRLDDTQDGRRRAAATAGRRARLSFTIDYLYLYGRGSVNQGARIRRARHSRVACAGLFPLCRRAQGWLLVSYTLYTLVGPRVYTDDASGPHRAIGAR